MTETDGGSCKSVLWILFLEESDSSVLDWLWKINIFTVTTLRRRSLKQATALTFAEPCLSGLSVSELAKSRSGAGLWWFTTRCSPSFWPYMGRQRGSFHHPLCSVQVSVRLPHLSWSILLIFGLGGFPLLSFFQFSSSSTLTKNVSVN